MTNPFTLKLGLAATLGSLLLAGCGDGAGPDSAAQDKNVENAQTMRSYFDKANGNYDNLTEVDKAAYVKQCGGEEKAQQNWNLMKNGPGAATRTEPGTPPPSGQ